MTCLPSCAQFFAEDLEGIGGSQALGLSSYPAGGIDAGEKPPGRIVLVSGEKGPYQSAVREHSDQAETEEKRRPHAAFLPRKKVAAATFLTR